jgi:hypothetical protein
VNTINPLLTDHAQRLHRERNGEAHPPHFLELARVDRPTSPGYMPQRTRSATSGISINLGSLRARWATSGMSINLGNLSARSVQVSKAFWWVPAGFAVLVLLRSIMGG